MSNYSSSNQTIDGEYGYCVYGGPGMSDFNHVLETDEAVLKHLPTGAKLSSASKLAQTPMLLSAKLVVEFPKQRIGNYFLREAKSEMGKEMMRAQFESHQAIHQVMAKDGFIARPVAWGPCKSKPNSTYFISTFHDQTSAQPNPEQFAAALAKLHSRSRDRETRFGFPVKTFLFDGHIAQERLMTITWEAFFTEYIRSLLTTEEEMNGDDTQLTDLKRDLLGLIIPRLLRPLETNGRRLKPSLCHSNLRPENISLTPDGIMTFNPVACWAHHEYDFSIWRHCNDVSSSRYFKAYVSQVPISEPAVDFEDRNALYALRFLIMNSIMYPGSRKYRGTMMAEMARLRDKFAPKVGEATLSRHVPLFSMAPEEYKGFHDEVNGGAQKANRSRQMSLVAGGIGGSGAKEGKSRSGFAAFFGRK